MDEKHALHRLYRSLEARNLSAARNLAECLEETLPVYRLGLFAVLSTCLKTTNCLETINALMEERCKKVDRWSNSNQR